MALTLSARFNELGRANTNDERSAGHDIQEKK